MGTVAAETIDEAVRLTVYNHFATQARAPVPAEIAQALDQDQSAVEQSLQRLADARVLVLAPGTPYIWMANPFSALPTPFSVEHEGRTFFGNCIWDALGIVAVLGGDGAVSTWCPDCGEKLRVAVADQNLVEPSGVVHFAVPAFRWWDDIGFN